MASTFQYWSGGAWNTETNLVRFTIVDTLGFPMSLEATIANPNNSRDTTYNTDYIKVRLLESDTNEILFYGKVERPKPEYDGSYGQVIRIFARDNFQELLKRVINSSYLAFVKRSALISQIVADHSYSGNINTANPAKFEASTISEAANQLDVSYSGSQKTALTAISELALEDPWNASPTGLAWDYYLDTTFVGNNPTPAMHYFRRGTRPAGGAAANGLTIAYQGAEGNQSRSMLADFNFPTESRELTTRVRIEYVTDAGDAVSVSVILINITNLALVFTVGETITGGTSGTTATVESVGTTFLCISGWSGLWTINEVITGASSGATANVQSVPRQSYEQDIEMVLRGYQITNKDEARDKAREILFHGGATITRGDFKIIRWPFFTILGVNSLVRSSHVVHVHVTSGTLAIDEDMLVTRITYDEGPGQMTAQIEVLRTARGRTLPVHVLDRVIDDSTTGMWSGMGSSGGVPAAVQIVNLTNVFTAVDDNDISWGAGTATFSDGSTQAVNAGALNLAVADIYYIYLVVGSANLSASTSFSDVVGVNSVLVAIAKKNAVATELAYVVSMNAGTPVLVAGTIIANRLSAISANMGLLTAGEIRTGSGTPGVDFTGFRIFSTYIAGYNADALQVYIRASDGRFATGAAGSETVIIDANGVHFIKGSEVTAYARFEDPAGTPVGFIYGNSTAGLVVSSLGGTLKINADLVRPSLSANQSIGGPNANEFWLNGYFTTLYTQDIRRRSGAGGDIGTATEYFSKIYIGQARNYISGTAGDMDFNVDNGAGASTLAMYIQNGASPVLTLQNTNLDMGSGYIYGLNEQTTVGAAGAASALPANPTGYVKIKDSGGTIRVIPFYAAS